MTGRLVLASLAAYSAAWSHPNIWTGGWTLTLGVITLLVGCWTERNSAELAALRREIAARPDRWAFTAALAVLASLSAVTIYLVTLLTWPIIAALLLGHALRALDHATDRRRSP